MSDKEINGTHYINDVLKICFKDGLEPMYNKYVLLEHINSKWVEVCYVYVKSHNSIQSIESALMHNRDSYKSIL